MEKEFRDMNDDELDKLFKDSSEKYFNQLPPEGAWDNFFHNKLNQAQETKKKRGVFTWIKNDKPGLNYTKWVWPAAAAGLLIIVLGIWIGLEKTNKQTNNVARDNNQPLKQKSYPADVFGAQQGAGIDTANGVSNRNTGFIAETYSNGEIQNGSSDSLYNVHREHLPVFGIVQIKPALNNTASVSDKNSLISIRPYLYNGNNTQRDNATKNIDHTQDITDLSKKPPVPLYYNEEDFEITINNERKTKDNQEANWQVGIVGGSNLTMVKGNVSDNPGLNTGVMIQRRINGSRISIETGVVRESMNYALDNSDFHPNGHNVSSEVSNIQGSCTMVDVPVNVRYDVIHSKKNNAFVSTGVSATWMANQNYNYQYAGNGGSTQVNKDVSGQGKTIYAVTNVSIGVEHHFKNTAIQLAPYVKLPLGTVGYGNINLGSVGAQISIKQRF